MKLVLVRLCHYLNFNLPRIYHGCGVRKKRNEFNELIDQANDERYSSPTHVVYWKFQRNKVPNKRYLTRGFLEELTEKGLLISYESILHLDEQKQYIILPIIILVNIILA